MNNCLICGKPAEWVRETQFAGSHYFCEQHAKIEDDFSEFDVANKPLENAHEIEKKEYLRSDQWCHL